MRTRAAGLVAIDGKIALMHRLNVKETVGTTKPFGEYWVFPGGGVEDDDKDLKDATKREILEEFGIEVDVKDLVYHRVINENAEEYLFYCEYIDGEFGTGTGPEFSHDPRYADRGEYIPTLVNKDDLNKIRLIVPDEYKNKIIEFLD